MTYGENRKPTIEKRATEILHQALGPETQFREGQLEAIAQLVVQRGKLLCVQRTGWGKSVVYFIATRLLREMSEGPTILISPLLALTRNQYILAHRFALTCMSICSTRGSGYRDALEKRDLKNVDLCFITPEQLAKDEEFGHLTDAVGGWGLFAVDEAHCISEWGHDFRPDFRRIRQVVSKLQRSPVLATTATATNAVTEDVNRALGDNTVTLRGDLCRDNLNLAAIGPLTHRQRLAWILPLVNHFDGSGIIYALTTRDCDLLAGYLRKHGVEALAYHARIDPDGELGVNELREEREQLLLDNKVKVLVASVALGMGFDKPDLGFVIHFQMPASPLAWYQQIGRAARGIPEGNIVLLHGPEDHDIHDYFITNAFPKPALLEGIVAQTEASDTGATMVDLLTKFNNTSTQIDHALKHLCADGVLRKQQGTYYRTPLYWSISTEIAEAISKRRKAESQHMTEIAQGKDCLMQSLLRLIDQPLSQPCGRCANCRPAFISELAEPTPLDFEQATDFFKDTSAPIEPRTRWANRTNIPEALRVNEGFFLCRYDVGTLGKLVAQGKYRDQRFSQELVDAAAEFLRQWRPAVTAFTFVPSSRHPNLVREFAHRLAETCRFPCIDIIAIGEEREMQKTMQNSIFQQDNANAAFTINQAPPISLLLIDDIVDSRWTFTVLAAKLREAGATSVFPFALASASKS